MKKYLIFMALFVPFLIFGSNTPQATNVTNSSRLYRTSFYLYAGSQYKFRTYSNDDTVVHILNSSNAQVAYNDDCGADLSSKIEKTSGSCSSTCRIFGGAYAYSSQSEGNARAVVDANTYLGALPTNDTDWDGLSNSLENVLGTSSTETDSDGDGLNDYIETLGTADILLPWEGSSPVEKDVFMEVDYFGRTINGNHFDFYEDFEANIENNLTYSFLEHGDTRFHIDVDDYLGIMEDGGTKVFARCGSAPVPPDAQAFYLLDEKANYFTSARTGIYYWLVAANRHTTAATTSSGVSCGSTSSGIGTDRIIVSIGHYATGGSLVQYSGTTIHELGHAFMLGHNDNDLGGTSVINRSIMNYRYQLVGVPDNAVGDSPYRYSSDNASNRTDLDWQYNNIVPDTGANGCLNSAAEANLSPKQPCVDARPNAQPTCDCTFDEWAIIDLDSAGVMGLGADSEDEQQEYYERPVFGLNGEILAENLDELVSSGSRYSKLTKESEKQIYSDNKKMAMEKYYTAERKNKLKSKYIEVLNKKGLKEGQDYEIIDGDVVFK